jgi:hypothetical protein
LSDEQCARISGQATSALEDWGAAQSVAVAVRTLKAITFLAGKGPDTYVVRVGPDDSATLAETVTIRAKTVAYAMLFNDDPDPAVAAVWQTVMDSFNIMYVRDVSPVGRSGPDQDLGIEACAMRGSEVEVPAHVAWGPKRWRPAECYKLAYLYALNRHEEVSRYAGSDLRIIHGRYLTDLPHAWIEFGEVVYDGTCARFYDRDSFYGSVKAQPQASYVFADAEALLQRTGTFGAWHNRTGETTLRP